MQHGRASTDRHRAEELVHFCYTTLLLRHPSEPTYATWTSVLACFEPECSSFDLRSKYEAVKNVWQSAKARLARSHSTPAALLAKLPLSFDELTADMQAAYGEARPLAQWPISTQEVERQFLRVPMRKDHKSLQENKKDVVHQLADLLATRLDGGSRRRSDESLNMLPGLKIFSPGKRSVTVDVAGNEKCNHLASLSAGQAGGIARGEPARFRGEPARFRGEPARFLSLTDGSMAPSVADETELRSTDPVAKAASASADADPNKMLQIVALPSSASGVLHEAYGAEEVARKKPRVGASSPVRQDRRLADGEGQSQPTGGNAVVPAGHGCNNDVAGSYGDVAQQFLDARKSEQMPKPAERSSSKVSKKKPAASAGLKMKRPAGCFKKPAAKVPEEIKAAEVIGYQNATFDAKKYGKCKVEYYTHKSYIRHFQEKSWKMGHSELPTIAEEKEESSSYESVEEEEGEPAREACPTREVGAAESREVPASSGRAPAVRLEKRAACPAEEESSESRAPRHRRRGRSESRTRAGRRTPSPARPRSPTVLPGAHPKSRPMVPEPPQPVHKGRGKGKRPEKPRCRFCWKEVTPHESGQSQHEYWSVYCLSWQFKLAGYPYSQCEQLAEDLKQRRMDSFQQWGPVMEAHVAFPADEPLATAAPALAARPAVPAPEAEARPLLPEPSHEDRRDPAPTKEKKHKEPRKESHKEKRKEKKREKATKAAAHDAVPEEKKKKKSKKDKGNKIHVIAVSPSPETMRRRKRDPPSSSESDGHEKTLTLVSCGGGKYRLVK
eukprot:s586_g18.t1